jgi:hypothetical protein
VAHVSQARLRRDTHAPRSYEVAEKHAGKFTHISPVWYNMDIDGSVTGKHDRDIDWVHRIKKRAEAAAEARGEDVGAERSSPALALVPRVALHEFTAEKYGALVAQPAPVAHALVELMAYVQPPDGKPLSGRGRCARRSARSFSFPPAPWTSASLTSPQ